MGAMNAFLEAKTNLSELGQNRHLRAVPGSPRTAAQ